MLDNRTSIDGLVDIATSKLQPSDRVPVEAVQRLLRLSMQTLLYAAAADATRQAIEAQQLADRTDDPYLAEQGMIRYDTLMRFAQQLQREADVAAR